jgi:hypothetical protein
MIALLCLFLTLFASPFKSKSRLEAENATLRYQLIVLQPEASAGREVSAGAIGLSKLAACPLTSVVAQHLAAAYDERAETADPLFVGRGRQAPDRQFHR